MKFLHCSNPKFTSLAPKSSCPQRAKSACAKKMLCEEFGFLGLYPLDNDLSEAPGETLDEKIFAANVAFLREADAAIFNLSPFRGVNADPGTAFELGFFAALGKPVFAYTNDASPLFDRVAGEFGVHATPEGEHCDARALLIENFGNADNLMLDCALKGQGRKVIRPEVPSPGLGDLAGFMACLRQVRLHFGF
jgi:nucleoside 2-deoxyribosyltransferase